MELAIYNRQDRLTVAAILIDNGYTVSNRKKKKTPTGKALEYYLEVQKNEENANTSRDKA